MKRFINREKITLTILSLLVIIVILSATFAWFMGATPVSVRNLIFNMDDKGDLYVWVKVEEDIQVKDMNEVLAILHRNMALAGNVATSGNMASLGNMATSGNVVSTENERYTLPTDEELRQQHFLPLQNVGTGDSVRYTIDMNIAEQDNIQENTLAPGGYGKIEFKILSMTSLTTGYTLTITPELMGINAGFETNGAGINESDLFDLVKTHIKFYAVNETGQYSSVIPYYDVASQNISLCCLQDDLEEGVMKDVVLYWYWPYEYVDIPDLYNVDSPVYGEYDKYRNTSLPQNKEHRQEDKVELYDWDDTYIGNYVEGLRFHFEVKGNR